MRYLVIISFLFLISCKTVKKDISKSNQHESIITEKTTTTRLEDKVISIARKHRLDDLHAIEFEEYTIYPRGGFLFQKEKGFTGTADSIIYRRSVESHSRNERTDTIAQSTNQNSLKQITESQEKKSKTNEIHKEISRTPSLIPYIGVGIVLLGLLWFVYKKFNPSKN